MRFDEILLAESVKKLEPMFNGFRAPDGTMPSWVANRINSVEKLLKRPDRVMWALRWERYIAAKKVSPELAKKCSRDLRFSEAGEEADITNYRELMQDHFPHWFSLPIPAMQNIVFERQSPSEIDQAFGHVEAEWKKSRTQIINRSAYPETDDDEEEDDGYWDSDEDSRSERYKEIQKRGPIREIIKLSQGWSWWDLNRTYCETEAGAMGHCGNKPSAQPGDRVLSLRKALPNDEFRPSLTFILHADGMLGEMKGRANDKPAERYHPAIIALLKDPMIKGIVGGGYEAQKNFSIFDLTPEQRDPLIAMKPKLVTIHDRLGQFEKEPTEENKQFIDTYIRHDLRRRGFQFSTIDFSDIKKPTIVIKEWESIEDYIGRQRYNDLSNITDFFDGLADIILDYEDGRLEDNEAEAASTANSISYAAREHYLKPVFKELHYYLLGEAEYVLNSVWHHEKSDGAYVLEMPVADYLKPSAADDFWMQQEDEDEEEADTRPLLDRLDDLTDRCDNNYNEDHSWSDVEGNVDIEGVGFEIAEYCFKQEDQLLPGIVAALIDEFGNATGQHYHSRDPNQMSLDLGDEDQRRRR